MPPIPREDALYDEAGYLRLYPGLAEAIAAGAEASAWRHFDKHGRREGRRPNDVDAAFYLQAYPQAADDIAAGRAADAAEHYIRWGRGRGYLPNAAAPPDTAAYPHDGGWLDAPHAADLIEGRVALGRMARRQAALLQSWVRNGFAVLDRPIEREVVTAAAETLERGFAGAFPQLLFECRPLSATPIPWQPEINPLPTDSLDPHFLSRAIRDLLFAEPLLEFLGLLFDAPPLVVHSRGRLREAATPAHRTRAAAAFSLPRQWASVWIPLEDANDAAGARFHYPGSHHCPEVPETHLAAQMTDQGLAADPYVAAAGRAVVRHPRLVHTNLQDEIQSTQRGFYAEYCPGFVAPTYPGQAPARLLRHGKHLFSAAAYAEAGPSD